MLRAIRGIGELRDPAAFRSWLVAIAIRQVRDSYRDRLAQPPAVESEVPSPDFADHTITRLGLTGQRLETAAATRWLDDEDRPVLALWWQEAAGELSRAELAGALGIAPAHAAVRVARMKERLDTSRTVVRALQRAPQCSGLAAITSVWGGEPSPLWRKRLARHVRYCPWCLGDRESWSRRSDCSASCRWSRCRPGWRAGRSPARRRLAGSSPGALAGRRGPAGRSRAARAAAAEGRRRHRAQAHGGVGGAGDRRGGRDVRDRPRAPAPPRPRRAPSRRRRRPGPRRAAEPNRLARAGRSGRPRSRAAKPRGRRP